MIINSTNKKNENVKFISYTGKYPCLCMGVLTLEIEGEKYKFGDIGGFSSFWSSGGNCGFTNNYADSYIDENEWIIDEEKLPEKFRKYAKEIDEVFNENVT